MNKILKLIKLSINTELLRWSVTRTYNLLCVELTASLRYLSTSSMPSDADILKVILYLSVHAKIEKNYCSEINAALCEYV